jgi:hypothetical protein
VARDLAERRLGFYLSRPLPPLSYFAGKMSAAFLLAVAAGCACLLPALVLGRGGLTWSALAGAAARSSAPYLVVCFVLAVGAAAGGAVRTRSRLLLLDFALLPVTLVVFLRTIGDSWRLGITDIVIVNALPSALAAATLVLLVASAAQVSFGRLDLERGRVWLSAIAWSGLLACVVAMNLYSRTVAGASPGELRIPNGVSLRAPRSGEHVMLEGVTTGRSGRSGPFGGDRFYAGFLLDGNGRVVKMAGLEGLTGLAWSADGRHFAWSKDSMMGGGSAGYSSPPLLREIPSFLPSVWVVSLESPNARPRQVPRPDQPLEAALALSASGRHLLVATERGKAVVDVETGATLASLDDPAEWASPRFLSETLVRALRLGASGQSRIVDWDSAARRSSERGAIASESTTASGARWYATLTPTQGYERVLRYDAAGLFLHDLDGRVAVTLVDGWTSPHRAAGLLSGGRVACIEYDSEGLRLRVFAPEGRPSLDARLAGRLLRVGGESAPGLLALGLAPDRGSGKRETAFVDLATGGVVRREPGVVPALRRWQPAESLGPRNPARGEAALQQDEQDHEPASLATRLLLGDEGVLLIDSRTGDRRLLVRRGDRRED